MDISLWLVWSIHLIVISLLVVVSGFLSGSETALTATSRSRILQRQQEGDRRADATLFLLDRYETFISVLLFANNMVNITASALATSIFINLYGDLGIALATVVMTFIILLFAEVTPKTYASAYPEDCSLIVSGLWMRLLPLFLPVTWALNYMISGVFFVLRIDPKPSHDAMHHIEELRGAIVQYHRSDDEDASQESDMMRSILELDDIDVSEVMTHRSEVSMLDLDKSNSHNINVALDSPYTRLPLSRGDSEDILGVLHAKKLLIALRTCDELDQLNLASIASPPWFIPENTTLLDQLQEFRRRREHFAVVVDEYGGLSGVVTLEDILEIIVGDIDDETDTHTPKIVKNSNGSYNVPGTTTLRTLNRTLGLDLPDGESYSTLAGLLLHHAKSIPQEGQSFLVGHVRIDVTARMGNQITALTVRILEEVDVDQSTE